MEKFMLDLERAIFEARQIQETISLLDSVAQNGQDPLKNFTNAINLMSNLAFDNCNQLEHLWNEMYSMTKKQRCSK